MKKIILLFLLSIFIHKSFSQVHENVYTVNSSSWCNCNGVAYFAASANYVGPMHWIDPSGNSFYGINYVDHLCPGDYSVQFKDKTGQDYVGYCTVSGPAPLNYFVAYVAPSCMDCCDGKINISTNAGCSNHVVQWDDPSIDMENVCVGNYPFTIHDDCGCLITDSVVFSRKFYPEDPSNENIPILFSSSNDLIIGDQVKEYTIYDIQGKKILYSNTPVHNTPLNLSYLNKGIYFVVATDKQQTIIQKKIAIL